MVAFTTCLDFFLSNSHSFNQATGYESGHKSLAIPSQDKLGGLQQEGHSAKKLGDGGGGGTVSSDEVASTQTVGASTSIIVPCTIKSRNNDGEK